LEKDGEVESSWDTSKTGPAIKVYQLTPVGKQKLEFWKSDIEMRIANLSYFLDTYRKLGIAQ
jgi:DNA-binding PadR family transcriptional regulator